MFSRIGEMERKARRLERKGGKKFLADSLWHPIDHDPPDLWCKCQLKEVVHGDNRVCGDCGKRKHPQKQAIESPADELLYGGSAGSGKSDLLLGLAICRHRQTILFRREFPQLKGIVDRAHEILKTTGKYNHQDHVWRMLGRQIEFASVPHEWDKEKFQGRPHDLIEFDQLEHFLRSQYRFLIGWNRTSVEGQRCRIVASCNPPTEDDGRWIVEEWAPWIDKDFADPAQPGELRWYTINDDRIEWHKEPKSIDCGNGVIVESKSRTFIPGHVTDNPYLVKTGYVSRLQSLPDTLRRQMLEGDFSAGMEPGAWQVIPENWLRAAFARWADQPPEFVGPWREDEAPQVYPIDALGFDVARGGTDRSVVTPRHDWWFGRQHCFKGSVTNDGEKAAKLVLSLHDGKCKINVDVIGIGASAYDFLKKSIGNLANPVNNAESTILMDRSRKFRFVNVRAASYWLFREDLDPANNSRLAICPDQELLAELCAVNYKVTSSGIQLEPKDDVIARLGRSPDKADSLILAHWRGGKRQFAMAL